MTSSGNVRDQSPAAFDVVSIYVTCTTFYYYAAMPCHTHTTRLKAMTITLFAITVLSKDSVAATILWGNGS